MHDSLILCIGHLENISSLSYTDFPNAGRVYCIVFKKKKTVNITDSITRIFSLKEYWEMVKFKVEKTNFT